ncbi:MAG: hypothetical protein JNK05_31770 [Myxococcales bacterium]|nr:hypothetical protein [Myxococcales bacterium]
MPVAFIVRWIASSFVAALFVVEHVRLARRAEKKWAWVVPLAPAAFAYRRGERFAAAITVLSLVVWLALRLTA